MPTGAELAAVASLLGVGATVAVVSRKPSTGVLVPLPLSPSGLQASDVEATRVTLTWDPVQFADAYEIFRDGIRAFSTAALTVSDASVQPTSTYSYQVRALNNAGQSNLSAPVSVTTPAQPPGVPLPPAGLSAVLTSGGVALQWSASAQADSFDLYRNGVLYRAGLTQAAFLDTAVSPGATYVYGVEARNVSGVSAMSATASATLPPPPPASVTGLSATPTSANTATVAWNASVGADAYVLLLDGAAQAPQAGTGAVLSGLTPGAHTVGVVASNAGGASAVASVALNMPSLPAAPSGLNASNVGATAVTLGWNALNDPTLIRYNVYRDGQLAYSTTSTSLVDGTVAASSLYRYQVSALNLAGEGALSAAVNVNTPAAAPGVCAAPTGLAASVQGGPQVALAWDPCITAASYNVYRDGLLLKAGLTSPAYVDGSVALGGQYAYAVAAKNAAGLSGQSAQVSVKVSLPKIKPHGCFSRTTVFQTGYRSAMGGYAVEATWAQLEPTAGVLAANSPIDIALADVQSWNRAHPAEPPQGIVVLIDAGIGCPARVASLSGGSFLALDPSTNTYKPCPFFWTPGHANAWFSFMRLLRDKYDQVPEFSLLITSRNVILGPTQTLREIDDAATLKNLRAAGYTDTVDKQNQQADFSTLTNIWSRTPVGCALGPYQDVTATSTSKSPSYTVSLMSQARTADPRYWLTDATGFRVAYLSGTGDAQTVYAGMQARGGPIGLTAAATLASAGDLATLLQGAASLGASFVILPAGYQNALTPSQVQTLGAALPRP